MEADDGSVHPLYPASILANEGKALRDLVIAEGAANTLETGMAYGVSTVWIAEGLHRLGAGTHVAIDPRQDRTYRSLGRRSVDAAGYGEYVEVVVEPSHCALPKLVDRGHQLDFAFIDGMHLFDFALLDFFYIDRMLADGGVVVFHDLWMPALRKLTGFIRRNRAYELVPWRTTVGAPVHHRAGRVMRRVRGGLASRDRSGWRFHVTSENMCALRKVRSDTRNHTHFAPF